MTRREDADAAVCRIIGRSKDVNDGGIGMENERTRGIARAPREKERHRALL
jgi:hypothetical protein